MVRRVECSRRGKGCHSALSIGAGNFSNVKSVGKGVSEYRLDFGPGYRIYFGQEGTIVVILLGGGSKKTQGKDIEKAQTLWAEYKSEKAKRK